MKGKAKKPKAKGKRGPKMEFLKLEGERRDTEVFPKTEAQRGLA
jgi:hypothetical protein